MSELRIGYGESCITPELGVSMAGYFEAREATAVHDELHARAIVFEADGTMAALLSCDMISAPKVHVDAIRQIVARDTSVPAEHVMVCATHTHTGPTTRSSEDANGPTIAWNEGLPERAAQAVILATTQLECVKMSGATSMEDRIAFNRRYHMKDGSVRTNPGNANPDIIAPAGPIDPEVGVLGFSQAEGMLRSVYVNYACHLDNVGGTEISADFPGYLVNRVRERLASSPTVLFTNGSCGDINHIDVRSPYRRKGHEHSRWMGETLAGDVCEALTDTAPLASTPVQVASKTVQLPMREDADIEKGVAEIQVIRVGDVAFVGIPAEYFVELQLDIKQRSPFTRTFVSELANGIVGYVPTRKAFEENMGHVPTERMAKFDHMGYEVRSALSRGFLPGVGEAMADTAVELLDQLHA